jgi:hypothetical protein
MQHCGAQKIKFSGYGKLLKQTAHEFQGVGDGSGSGLGTGAGTGVGPGGGNGDGPKGGSGGGTGMGIGGKSGFGTGPLGRSCLLSSAIFLSITGFPAIIRRHLICSMRVGILAQCAIHFVNESTVGDSRYE